MLEMYYAFTGQTGWLVPLNLAAWSDEVRPGGCRGVKVKALWVHETQYPAASVASPSFDESARHVCACCALSF